MKSFRTYISENRKFKGVMNFLSDELDAEDIDYHYYDDMLGHKFDLIFEDTVIQLSIKETENNVYLTGISVKEKEDLSKVKSGTGLGKRSVYLLKDYVDRNNKGLVVVDATEYSVGFWDKFSFLDKMGDLSFTDPKTGETLEPEGNYGYQYRIEES